MVVKKEKGKRFLQDFSGTADSLGDRSNNDNISRKIEVLKKLKN
jgi:hypothetical protein